MFNISDIWHELHSSLHLIEFYLHFLVPFPRFVRQFLCERLSQLTQLLQRQFLQIFSTKPWRLHSGKALRHQVPHKPCGVWTTPYDVMPQKFLIQCFVSKNGQNFHASWYSLTVGWTFIDGWQTAFAPRTQLTYPTYIPIVSFHRQYILQQWKSITNQIFVFKKRHQS